MMFPRHRQYFRTRCRCFRCLTDQRSHSNSQWVPKKCRVRRHPLLRSQTCLTFNSDVLDSHWVTAVERIILLLRRRCRGITRHCRWSSFDIVPVRVRLWQVRGQQQHQLWWSLVIAEACIFPYIYITILLWSCSWCNTKSKFSNW